jgi:N-acetylglucosamine-6-phosphate deacetylase
VVTRTFTGGRAVIDGALVTADIEVTKGVIAAIVERGEENLRRSLTDPPGHHVIDCSGLILSPGFIDLQCNGAGGHDITSEPDAIAAVGSYVARFGVTTFLPTVVTCPAEQRRAAIDALQALRSTSTGPTGADPLGLHFEGPMISRSHLGAHRPEHVAALDTAEIDSWIESDVVALVTLAPETPGALDATEHLAGGGIVVSAGHTAMTPDDLARARARGLGYVTHLFNAMAPFNHRSPGPIGAVLGDDTVVAGIITDGIHVDPIAVRMAWQVLGRTRMSLVSDAVGALGAPHGRRHVAGLETIFDETGVRTADGVLAGSALALDQAVRNLIAWTGCDVVDAISTVTTTPADLLGLGDRGRLRVGARADLTILDDECNLVETVVAGDTIWSSHPRSAPDATIGR